MMSGLQQYLVATLIFTLLIPGTAALPDDNYAPGDPVGAATVVAEVQSGLDAVLTQLPFFSFISDINKETFQQGETIDLQLKDIAEYSCDDSVFVVEGYAPEPPSDRSPEIRALDHLTGYDPILNDQLVTADVSMKLPADAEPGEWTIVAYTYCYTQNQKLDDGGDIVYKTITVEEPTSTDDGSSTDSGSTTEEPFLTISQQPSVTVSGTQVRTTVGFRNEGGDVPQEWTVEMQVQPKGGGLLSFASVDQTEELCDPTHPENVHKDFSLAAGQSGTLDLTTSVEAGEKYDVYLVTGTGCANEGGEPAGPYPSGVLVDTVCVGNCSSSGGGTGDQQRVSLLMLVVAGVVGAGLIVYGVRRVA